MKKTHCAICIPEGPKVWRALHVYPTLEQATREVAVPGAVRIIPVPEGTKPEVILSEPLPCNPACECGHAKSEHRSSGWCNERKCDCAGFQEQAPSKTPSTPHANPL